MASGYLLDTCILVHLIRGNAIGQAVESKYQLCASPSRGVISVVTVGEIYSLCQKFNWKQKKLNDMRLLLNNVIQIDISQQAILNAYAAIDHSTTKAGQQMGKNDVWIAATANVTNLTLMTADHDFDHIHGTFVDRLWIDPSNP